MTSDNRRAYNEGMKAANSTNQEQVDTLFSKIDSWMDMEAPVQTPRGSGPSFIETDSSGDGYWCPTHESSCHRGCDERRWGKYGAAGVLFFHRESGTFLLNQRSMSIHFGGTWSTIGGALNKDEEALEGALREAEEEVGQITVGYWQIAQETSVHKGTHTDWTYSTHVVEVDERWEADTSDWETMDNAWVSLQDMATMKLHPGFKSSLTGIAREMYYQGAFA